MKIKLSIILSILLFLGHSLSQAQLITISRSSNFPLSQTLTLTQTGPLTVIWSGSINYSNNVTATLQIDSVTVDTYVIAPADGTAYQSRPFRSSNLSPGNHTIQLTVSGTSQRQDPVILSIAEAEPTAGVQAALNQLTAAYQSADAAVQAGLMTQIDAIQSALDTRITILESQISSLQTSDNNQSAQITALTGQLNALQVQQTALINQVQSTLQSQITNLNSTIAGLETRIATLENSTPSQDPAIPTLQSQMAALTASRDALQARVDILEQHSDSNNGGGTTIIQSGKQGLKTTDYLIIGGSAAGATALGIGIYSILNDESGDTSETVPAKNENRPGCHE